MRIIFLNGPPGCGKDTAAELLVNNLGQNCLKTKFAYALKNGAHALLGLKCDFDAYEDGKNNPQSDFFGLSPRQLYINLSENFMKPQFGEDIFGRVLLRQLCEFQFLLDPDYALISDSGFRTEAQPIIEHFGLENCLLIQIQRPGHDFKGDSRGYINLYNETDFIVVNSGTLNEFKESLLKAVKWRWPL